MPSGGKIRIPGRQSADAMQVIGQNNDGLDGEWSPSAGRLEHLPKVVNIFGQEFPAAFQQRDREKEHAAWNQGVYVLRHDFSLTQLLKAGCASLSRPTATGGSEQFKR
jgi:hypothetical protein